MEFSFSNLGIVKEANISLNGITVITGLNDTGKSFISKGIYSIIKAINDADSHITLKRTSAISGLFNQINFTHRQIIPFTQERVTNFNVNPTISRISEILQNKNLDRSQINQLVDGY